MPTPTLKKEIREKIKKEIDFQEKSFWAWKGLVQQKRFRNLEAGSFITACWKALCPKK